MQTSDKCPSSSAHVRVLLATFNGVRWLDEQLQSIVWQRGVRVSIVASDDRSDDGTAGLLDAWAGRAPLYCLPTKDIRMGNANQNFLRLIRDTPLDDAEYFALSDQDDIWLEDKLQHAVASLTAGADAYSSNVCAFWPDGRAAVLDKAQPQRPFDHVFESSGPGCTFVFPRHRFEQLQAWVTAHHADLVSLKVHDWLIYAHARERGWSWHIDPSIGLRYRQHGGNEAGANIGLKAIRVRLRRIQSGLFRQEALAIADAIGAEHQVILRLRRFSAVDRLWLAWHADDLRRRRRDQWTLRAFLLLMPRTGGD